jgi:N-hydroxyarylamine O-acetyltransferase
MALNVDRYLDRIGYDGPREPRADVLRELHRRHLFSVPFENLDIGLGRPIALDEEAFVGKIVDRRRGGFCYEVNGAFAALLRALGFEVELLAAASATTNGAFGPEYDHLALRVTIDGEPWLADVGFGDCFVDPLRLDDRAPQDDYRIEERDGSLVVQRKKDGAWSDEYHFKPIARELAEFGGMCHFHQTSPESHFTQKRIISVATPSGRVSVSNSKLIVTDDGVRTERELADDGEWRAVLAERFGVIL